MTVTDQLIANNEAYAERFDGTGLPGSPAQKVAVVACMDARLDVHGALGLELGDVHVIRNAGGVVTDDTIRSVAISQHLLGTEEIVLLHHTDCGMQRFTDSELAEKLEQECGERPPWRPRAFADLDESVRQSIRALKESPFIPHKAVRGFVFDVKTGKLREVVLNSR